MRPWGLEYQRTLRNVCKKSRIIHLVSEDVHDSIAAKHTNLHVLNLSISYQLLSDFKTPDSFWPLPCASCIHLVFQHHSLILTAVLLYTCPHLQKRASENRLLSCLTAFLSQGLGHSGVCWMNSTLNKRFLFQNICLLVVLLPDIIVWTVVFGNKKGRRF